MLRGRARFTVDGNDHELGPGQLVFVRDPALRRSAVALEADTAVLAIGGKPGARTRSRRGRRCSRPSPHHARRTGTRRSASTRRRWRSSPDHARAALQPRVHGGRGGRRLDALVHLQRAVAARAEVGRVRAQGLRLRRDPERARLPRLSSLHVAGQARPRQRAQRRHRIRSGARDEQHRAEPVLRRRARRRAAAARPRARTPCAPAPAERHELLRSARGPRARRRSVTAPIETSLTTGSPSLERDADRERVRPGQRLAAVGMRRAARGEVAVSSATRPRVREPAHPVAEQPVGNVRERRRAAPCVGGSASWARTTAVERQVAERAVPVPALEARLRRRRAAAARPCRATPSVSSHSIRERPCPGLPRCSASRKCAASVSASSARKPSAREPRAAPRQRTRRTRTTGQPRSRRDPAQLAVRVRRDRMPDRLEERQVAVGVRVRGRRGEVEALAAASSRSARALPSPCSGAQRAAGVRAVDDLAGRADRAVEAEVVRDVLARSPAASRRRCRRARRARGAARRGAAAPRRRAGAARAPSRRRRAAASPATEKPSRTSCRPRRALRTALRARAAQRRRGAARART